MDSSRQQKVYRLRQAPRPPVGHHEIFIDLEDGLAPVLLDYFDDEAVDVAAARFGIKHNLDISIIIEICNLIKQTVAEYNPPPVQVTVVYHDEQSFQQGDVDDRSAKLTHCAKRLSLIHI